MKEKAALRLSLVCSFFGLAALYAVSSLVEAGRTSMGSLSITDAGSTFMLCGNLSRGSVSNGHVFQTLTDSTGSMRLVLFNSTAPSAKAKGIDIYNLSRRLCIEAEVDEYPKGSGTLELVYRGGRINA